MKHKSIRALTVSASVAAVYVFLTYITLPISFGSIQFRVAEIMNVFALFTPLSVYGLTVGCFLSNLLSFNPFDVFIGTAATLISSWLIYLFRTIKIKNLPILSMLMPVIFNGLFIGFELTLYAGKFSLPFFLLSALSVAAGESVASVVGLLLYKPIKNTGLVEKVLKNEIRK